jgi:hypothetical protein
VLEKRRLVNNKHRDSMELEKTLRPLGARKSGGVLCAVLAATSLPAADVDADVDADVGDYTALPAGTNLAVRYDVDAEDGKVFARSDQVAGSKLKTPASRGAGMASL